MSLLEAQMTQISGRWPFDQSSLQQTQIGELLPQFLQRINGWRRRRRPRIRIVKMILRCWKWTPSWREHFRSLRQPNKKNRYCCKNSFLKIFVYLVVVVVETILGRFQGEILEPAGTGRVSPRVEAILIDHGGRWRHFHLLKKFENFQKLLIEYS